MTTTDVATLDELHARLPHAVHRPGTDGYLRLATPWNIAVPSRPLAVVEAASAADVVVAVRWAASAGVQVAVRATGHGAAAELDGVLLVHTGRLTELTIDPSGAARAGAGVRWGAVIEAGAPLGLAPLCGSSPTVGVVGFLTGGGLGPMARTFGVSSDRVTGFDVVTGDGELRRATATENPALFWGLRGGKGALGIVTAVEFDLVPVPSLFAGAVYFDGADAGAVMRTWATWSRGLPPEATTSIAVVRLPRMPGVPEPLAGRVAVAVRFAFAGETAAGEAALAPMRGAAPVVFGGVGPLPLAMVPMIHSDPVDPMPASERATLLRELPDDAVEALVGAVGPQSSCAQVIVEVRQLGGAVASGDATASAFCHRDVAYSLLTIGIAAGPHAEPTRADALHIAETMRPWATDGAFPNFGASTSPDRVHAVYDTDVIARLGTLTATFDPFAVLADAEPIRQACTRLAIA